MTREGPLLETLTRRLTETPPEFLADTTETLAVVNDLLRMQGATSVSPLLDVLVGDGSPDAQNRGKLARVFAWLFADGWFVSARIDVLPAILSASAELAPLVAANKAVASADRREELARLALSKLDLRPQGESEALAKDRLVALSTAERARVLAASRAAEERARKIREELARKAAQEAADKASRE
ncbi:MAG: hypothetical protein HOV80_28075 [Polyangiaceae bacterium]|nr:hypothetical protein [Polyangiaceae bacterium]